MTIFKKNKSQLRSASEVLQSLLKNSKSPVAQQFQRWQLWSRWPEVVGKDIASYSMPVGYLRGTLFVWVDSAARLQDMMFILEPTREIVNKYLGKSWVKKIRLTTDQKFVPKAATQKWSEFLQDHVGFGD